MSAGPFSPRPPRRRLHPALIVLIVLLIVAIAAAVFWLFGWLITVIVGWFGPHLAVWQGMLIAALISALTGGGGSAGARGR